MAWGRFGDGTATHSIVMRAVSVLRRRKEDNQVSEREVISNELLGWVIKCASVSALHETDYVITYGNGHQFAGGRADRLFELAEECGYFAGPPEHVNGEDVWTLVDDPTLIHMIRKDEREWRAQRQKDNANPRLLVPVKLRDGDHCRYCTQPVVRGGDKKSHNYATTDHRVPGEPGTVATLVVACGNCNKQRGDLPDAELRVPLMPEPERPYYGPATLRYFALHRKFIPAEYQHVLELLPPATTDDTAATRRPAGDRALATPPPAGQRASTDHEESVAPVDEQRSADPADRGYTESGFAGSGRVGSGRVPGSTGRDPQISADRPLTQRNPHQARRGRRRTRRPTSSSERGVQP